MGCRAVTANCVLSIDNEESEFVTIVFGLQRSLGATHAPEEVATVIMTARTYEDLGRRIAQGPPPRMPN